MAMDESDGGQRKKTTYRVHGFSYSGKSYFCACCSVKSTRRIEKGRPGMIPATGPRFSATLNRRSRKVPIDLGKQLGEVEFVRAGGAGGLEVGAGPVAGFR